MGNEVSVVGSVRPTKPFVIRQRFWGGNFFFFLRLLISRLIYVWGRAGYLNVNSVAATFYRSQGKKQAEYLTCSTQNNEGVSVITEQMDGKECDAHTNEAAAVRRAGGV